MESVALEAKSRNARGKLCNSNLIHDLIPSNAAAIAIHLVPFLFCFPLAWFQILNYSCFSPTAHISLIHYWGGIILTASRPFKPFAIVLPNGTTVGIRLLEIPTEAGTMGGGVCGLVKGN